MLKIMLGMENANFGTSIHLEQIDVIDAVGYKNQPLQDAIA